MPNRFPKDHPYALKKPFREYMEHKEKLLLNTFFKRDRPLSYLVNNFTKYAVRQDIARFMLRHDLFKMIVGQQGCIVECGILYGSGLMSWAMLSAILEPENILRRIYGFDTFKGFPSIHENDTSGGQKHKVGHLKDNCYDELLECIDLYDMNRFISPTHQNYSKVVPIKGDFMKTGKKFIKDNPHLLVSLLYLDFDLYKPTKEALKLFVPRMPKGSIICFDEINHPDWPGETMALLEELDIRNIKIQKLPYETKVSFIVL